MVQKVNVKKKKWEHFENDGYIKYLERKLLDVCIFKSLLFNAYLAYYFVFAISIEPGQSANSWSLTRVYTVG